MALCNHRYEQVCGLLDVRKSHILKKLAALRTPDPPPAIEEEEEQIEVYSSDTTKDCFILHLLIIFTALDLLLEYRR